MLNNIGQKYEGGKVYWEAYLMQAIFLVIMACHIPFVNFAGKESLLIIVDEAHRKSISATISLKLKAALGEEDGKPMIEHSGSMVGGAEDLRQTTRSHRDDAIEHVKKELTESVAKADAKTRKQLAKDLPPNIS